jgi:hypothetical protein
VGQVGYIPEESAPQRGLAQVNREIVQEVGRRCADQKFATVDLDATIIENWNARRTRPRVVKNSICLNPIMVAG